MSKRVAQMVQDVHMIKDDSFWPMWPFLPLKSVKPDKHGERKLAFMSALDSANIVRLGNYLEVKKMGDISKLPYKTYESINDLVEEWMVD